MSFGFRIKRSATDAAFSDYVRMKANYICARCFRGFENNTQILHLSHYVGRGNKAVRWDEENAIPACFSCHKFFTENPHAHMEFFLKRLGQKRYDALILRSHLGFKDRKMDESLIRKGYQMLLKELKGRNKILGAR